MTLFLQASHKGAMLTKQPMGELPKAVAAAPAPAPAPASASAAAAPTKGGKKRHRREDGGLSKPNNAAAAAASIAEAEQSPLLSDGKVQRTGNTAKRTNVRFSGGSNKKKQRKAVVATNPAVNVSDH